MSSVLEPRIIARVFRVVAILEAITWLALLIAMYFKWVEGHTEAVAVPGMVHGIVFVVFVVVSLVTARVLRWSVPTTAWALFSSIPPFGTLVFEVWAQRTGRLERDGDRNRVAEGAPSV
ncbi:DUF3817 domain-containing protein [Williamsia deligens]|uniref:DUF3817 domain-containing protein n=1 Tax=Williamsia deligens TaxID=321325 RepID=A0ABW3GEE2_9NOCA|nr:DUF3817 domain-containing protein [Williamsia deligens]MCP2195668.1 integral membrane protein [Williamsia deligens]